MEQGKLDSGGEDWSEKRSPEHLGKCSKLQSSFYALAVKNILAAGVELSVSQRFKLYPLRLTTKNSTIRAIMTAIPIHIIMSVCSPPNFQSCKKFLSAIITLKTRLGNRCIVPELCLASDAGSYVF